MKQTRHISHKGFTIIETLVAVTLLMISIAGPLLIAGKGLTSALYAKDQMTASYLAQETMEIVKNQKANSEATFGAWVSGLNSTCYFDRRCDIGITYSTMDCGLSGVLCQLYIDRNNIYSSDPSGDITVFKRGVYLEQPDSPKDHTISSQCGNTAMECRVHVIVTWNTTTVQNQIDLYTNLAATQ